MEHAVFLYLILIIMKRVLKRKILQIRMRHGWKKIKEADIPFEISDERQCGRHINVTFAGELRQEQKPALEEMMRHDNGILQAATAFGKTVVCSAMIAEKKVNTLIILESSALLEQWKDALEKFLDIDEKFPEYKTKTGQIRVRKSLIGKLQGAHDSMTGIVDIAMAGSLCKKGEWHPLLDQYGMVIVDECHHAAADTIAEVLQNMYMVLQLHQNDRMDWKRSIICCLARSDTVILQKKK